MQCTGREFKCWHCHGPRDTGCMHTKGRENTWHIEQHVDPTMMQTMQHLTRQPPASQTPPGQSRHQVLLLIWGKAPNKGCESSNPLQTQGTYTRQGCQPTAAEGFMITVSCVQAVGHQTKGKREANKGTRPAIKPRTRRIIFHFP